MINPALSDVAPLLKWSARDDRWDLLGYQYIKDGRHADYSPESDDLPKVGRALVQLQEVPAPDVELTKAVQRWGTYTERPELFDGNYLLRTNWNPRSVLVTPGRAYLLDWTWPVQGAGWIDPACWVVWLIAAGHLPRVAEEWASRAPSWALASGEALDQFALAQAAMWLDTSKQSDDNAPWVYELADAAKVWVESRGL